MALDKKKNPISGRVDTAVGMHYLDANKTYGEKAYLKIT